MKDSKLTAVDVGLVRRSPAEVAEDPRYEVQRGFQSQGYYPSAVQFVVKHRETRTYWECVYGISDDDSDYEQPAGWGQVERHEKMVVKFK